MSNIFDALKKKAGAAPYGPDKAAAQVQPEMRADTPASRRLSFRISRELEALRERLEMELPRTGRRVFSVAGAIAGEGASTLGLELARTMAREGAGKSLLLDADLGRSPRTLSRAIRAAQGRPGLIEVVTAKADLSKAVLATDEPNLHFLPAGQEEVRSLEALGLGMLQEFLDDMGRTYRNVVVDCPAILEHPDTPVLAALTDGLVLVVRAGRTRREVVQKSLMLLTGAHCRVLGVVLNQRQYPIPDFLYRRL